MLKRLPIGINLMRRYAPSSFTGVQSLMYLISYGMSRTVSIENNKRIDPCQMQQYRSLLITGIKNLNVTLHFDLCHWHMQY